jgi:hypothetical protein
LFLKLELGWMSVLIVREIHVIIMLVYTLDQYRRMATVNEDPVQNCTSCLPVHMELWMPHILQGCWGL